MNMKWFILPIRGDLGAVAGNLFPAACAVFSLFTAFIIWRWPRARFLTIVLLLQSGFFWTFVDNGVRPEPGRLGAMLCVVGVNIGVIAVGSAAHYFQQKCTDLRTEMLALRRELVRAQAELRSCASQRPHVQ